MKSWMIALGLGALLTLANATDPATIVDSSGQVTGANIVVGDGGVCNVLAGQGLHLQLPTRFSMFALDTGHSDYSQWTHLVFTITNNRPTVAVANIAIDSGTNGWAYADIAIAGNSTETVAMPLVSANTANLAPSWPSMDGFFPQATTVGSSVPTNVRMVRIWNLQQQSTLDLTLNEMTLVQQTPKTTSIIDQYGQQTVTFAGKIASDVDLQQQAAEDALLSGQLPYTSDAYQGVAGSGLTQGTGRWHTEKQNGKWYIIDPAGNRFFSTAINCVGTGTLAYVQNRSALFAPGALPAQNGPFAMHYQQLVNPSTGLPEPGFNFYTANLQRKYGSNWRLAGVNNCMRRLRTWGFNTIGPISDALLSDPSNHFPGTPSIVIAGNFRTVPTLRGDFAMPDVYDPAWASAVNTTLASVVPQLNQNAYNMGLFIDNELPWAFHSSQTNYRYDFAFDVLSAPSNQPAKQRFYSTLQMKYRTIQKLNTAWGTTYASWNALLANTSYRPTTIRSALATDMQAFLSAFSNQYFSTIRSKLQALQYRGLYLGCRFLYYSPETLSAAARYCDVLSFNAYDLTPSQWRTGLRAVDKPVMISEFGFGAGDMGRVGGSGPITEADRIAATQTYLSDAMSWTNLVGVHWYKWDDDPATGRMWDNANHDLGMVSITDKPYQGLVDLATQMNTQFNSRMINP